MKQVVILFLLFPLFCAARREPSAFGKVSLEDFTVKEFPEASSVVLFDKSQVIYDPNEPGPHRERHLRVLIRRKDHFERWGNYVLGGKFSKAKKIKAAIYEIKNGGVVAVGLNTDDIQKGSNSKEKAFALPNLKEGCVVEISYTSVYSIPISPDWLVQADVPVLWAEYRLSGTVPLSHFIYGGIRPVVYEEKENGTLSRCVFINVPPFKPEEHMGLQENYFGRIKFAFTGHDSWSNVSQDYLDANQYFNERLSNRPLKRKAEEITAQATDDLDKARRLCDFIKAKVKWNGYWSSGSTTAEKALEAGTGSSADINILLHMMLRALGMNPKYILLSTRSNGSVIKEFASSYQFNHVIVGLPIGDGMVYLDCTDPMLPFGVLPDECVNLDALELIPSSFKWVELTPAQRDKVTVSARLNIFNDHSLKGRINIVTNGYDARKHRLRYVEKGEKLFIKERDGITSWDIDSAKILYHDKYDMPLQEKYFASIPGRLNETPSRVYLDPYILLVPAKNIWRDENRVYPIDLGLPSENVLVATITLPPNYKVESLPENRNIVALDGAVSCTFNLQHNANVLIVTYQMTLSRTLFARSEYQTLRTFYNEIIAKQSEPIVLVKNGM